MCSTVGELVELKGSLQWFHKGSIYDCLSTFLSVFVPLISAKQAVHAKIQQTKMLVTCLRFGDLLLFELIYKSESI